MNRRHRSIKFLGDELQTRFLVLSLLHFAAIIITFVIALFLPIMTQLDDSSLSVAERSAVADNFLLLHERVWAPLLIALLLLMVHAVFFSLRIVGPLGRFREFFKKIGEGDLALAVKIRKGDYLQREARCLEDMVTALSGRIGSIKAECAEVVAAAVEIRESSGKGSTGDFKEKVADLEERARCLKGHLDKFRTRDEDGAAKVSLPETDQEGGPVEIRNDPREQQCDST